MRAVVPWPEDENDAWRRDRATAVNNTRHLTCYFVPPFHPAHLCSSMLITPFVLALAAGYARATALTAILTGNERSCYYADVDGVGEKVGECRSALRAITADSSSLHQAFTLRSNLADRSTSTMW